MSAPALTRRAALGVLAAAALAAARPASAQSSLRIRAIRVDASRLRAASGDPTAAWVERALPEELAKAFAPWMAPGGRDGATLTVRIDTVFLASAPLGDRPERGVDEIEGVAVVDGARERAPTATPLRATTSYRSSSVDDVQFERRNHFRVIALARAFAHWLPRQMGL